MIRHVCPNCDLVIPSADNLAGLPIRCPHCHVGTIVPQETVHSPKTDDSGFYAAIALNRKTGFDPQARHFAHDSRRMFGWRMALKSYYASIEDLSVLVAGVEHSGGIGARLAPFFANKPSRHYVVAFRHTDSSLCLFRYERGLLGGFDHFVETEEIPLRPEAEVRFHTHGIPRGHSLHFRDSQGQARVITFSLSSRTDSKSLATCLATTTLALR